MNYKGYNVYDNDDFFENNLNNKNAVVEHSDIETVDFASKKYDKVVSRLLLHYIDDLKSIFTKVYECLEGEGEFVFSIEHPLITSCYDSYHQNNKRG